MERIDRKRKILRNIRVSRSSPGALYKSGRRISISCSSQFKATCLPCIYRSHRVHSTLCRRICLTAEDEVKEIHDETLQSIGGAPSELFSLNFSFMI